MEGDPVVLGGRLEGFGRLEQPLRQVGGLDPDRPAPAAGVAGQGQDVDVDRCVTVVRAVGDLVVIAVGFEGVGQGQVEALLIALDELREENDGRREEAR